MIPDPFGNNILNLIQVPQLVQHRLKILRERCFPGKGFAGAGVGDAYAPGVEELSVHPGFNMPSLSAK
jgi:hypothetical protein